MDEAGTRRQRWETFATHKEALRRKAEVENCIHEGTFIAPSNQTVAMFLEDFVTLYGENKWGVSAYDANTSLIRNYINPAIGNELVQSITPKFVDQFYRKLQKTKAVSVKTRRPRTEFVANATIEKIQKLLVCAFKQAVRWELVARNPFEFAMIPKTSYQKRDIWTVDIIRQALNACTDSKLYVAMNLSFACSCRLGEILGLTWDNVHISDEDIAKDDANIFIDKELERCSKRAIDMIGKKDIIHIFEPLMPNTSTRLVLKKPKTESSIRKIWLPKTLAYILREWHKAQLDLKGFLGDEYQSFNLVVAQSNGRPCEGRIIEESFQNLKRVAGLPNVVFHSLRHSSATYKLKLNHGDMKATQGDTGHAQMAMVADIYAHILDEDRKINAQKFEASFYSNPDLRAVRAPVEPTPATTIDLAGLVEQIQKEPELANMLAGLLAAQRPDYTQ
jgi:integrase